jgi:hypothetical protein
MIFSSDDIAAHQEFALEALEFDEDIEKREASDEDNWGTPSDNQ